MVLVRYVQLFHRVDIALYAWNTSGICSTETYIYGEPNKQIFYYNRGGVVGFGFATPYFVSSCHSPFIKEFHVDSTYKTNRMGYELFGVIANINGIGFPIAYMLLGMNSNVQDDRRAPSRMEVIRRFFGALRNAGFRPTYMFTDKDRGQINAMERVWGRDVVRLCLWHFKRSVKMRLSGDKVQNPNYDPQAARQRFPFVSLDFLPSRDRSGKVYPDSDHRDAIGALVGRHYDMHPSIPFAGGMLIKQSGK